MKNVMRSLAVAGLVGVAAVSGTAANAAGGDAVPTAKKSTNVTVTYGSMGECWVDMPYMYFSGYDLIEGCHAGGGGVQSVWRYSTGWW